MHRYKIDYTIESKVSDTVIIEADSVLLEKDDYKVDDNGVYYVNKNRKKTGSEFITPILGFGVDILKRRDFSLNIISNQKMNAYLHVIERMIGFKKSLHSHLARHTYSTLLLNKGVRLETVSHAVGHSSVKVTEQYYAFMHTQTILNEIASVVK